MVNAGAIVVTSLAESFAMFQQIEQERLAAGDRGESHFSFQAVNTF